MNLKYSLTENLLTERPDDFLAQVHPCCKHRHGRDYYPNIEERIVACCRKRRKDARYGYHRKQTVQNTCDNTRIAARKISGKSGNAVYGR